QDSALDHGTVAGADVRQASSVILGTFGVGFEPVGADEDGVFNGHVAADAAAQTDDTVGYLCACLNDTSVADQALFQPGAINAGSGQEAHTGINDPFLTVKVKRRMVAGQSQIRFMISLDGSQVLPIAIEEMGMNAVGTDAAGKDFPSKIRG